VTVQTVHIGVLTLDLHIPASGSLKDKRRVLRSLKDRIHNKFNAAVAEIDFHDKWQRAGLGICTIGNDKSYLNGSLDTILQLTEGYHEVQITDYNIEFI